MTTCIQRQKPTIFLTQISPPVSAVRLIANPVGCHLNRYDISHELVVTPEAEDPAAYIATEIPVHVVEYIEKRFAELGGSVHSGLKSR